MTYTVRQGLKLVYALIGQQGATATVGMDDQFLYLTNSALNMIYNYEGYYRSRQHTKALFILHTPSKTYWKLRTKYPIREVDRFFEGGRKNNDTGMTACDMECDLEDQEFVDECTVECDQYGKSIELAKVLPKNKLCAGQYAITGGNRETEFGGLDGSIIEVQLKYSVDSLRVTYFRDLVHVKSFDDILPIPDKFLTAWAYYVAGHITPLYGIMMQQQDLNFLSLARKEIEALKKQDTMGFKNMIYDEKHFPLYSKNNVF